MGGNTPLLNSVELEDFQGDPDVQETIDLKEKYKKKLKR